MQTFLCKPEVFWVGVQSVVAFAALIGLFFYTKYTRRMMEISESARRMSVLPSLVIQADTVEHEGLVLEILNAGTGAALNIRLWSQTVSNEFSLDGKILAHNASVKELFLGTLLSQKGTHLVDENFSQQARLLYVVEADDLTGGSQQMQLLTTPNSADRHVLQVHKENPNVPQIDSVSFLQTLRDLFRWKVKN